MIVLAGISEYASIAWLLAIALVICASMLILSHLIGPRRRGPVKESPYESGVDPIGDARRRFHVRFFLVAMLFLLFDVEIVLLWPWAPVFVGLTRTGGQAAAQPLLPAGVDGGFLLIEAGLFGLVLLVGYLYAWRKGAFRFQ